MEILGTGENGQLNEPSEEEKKKQADALWADFLQDTGFKSKNTITNKVNSTIKEITNNPQKNFETQTNKKTVSDKVKITEIFEFAGEEVKVEKEVPKHSVEARLLGDLLAILIF